MRTTIVLGLVIFVSACASYRKTEPTRPVQAAVEKKERRVTKPVKKVRKSGPVRSQAVWHLIYPSDAVEFALVHQGSGKKEFIRVETTLSEIDLPTGLYSIEAMVVGNEKFEALEGQELFQFEIKKKSPTYIGSYVVECPKVGSLHMGELRKMKFFNRLNFTGETGVCELIVGNDLDNVRRAWSKLEKKSGRLLQIGF